MGDQTHRTSCLELLVSAVAAWNTVYLEQAATAFNEAGEQIPDEFLPHIGNHGWEHINLLGHYNFDRVRLGPSMICDHYAQVRRWKTATCWIHKTCFTSSPQLSGGEEVKICHLNFLAGVFPEKMSGPLSAMRWSRVFPTMFHHPTFSRVSPSAGSGGGAAITTAARSIRLQPKR